MKPVINILTRTSNRPNYFRNCIESVKKQDYDNINHIVSVDNQKTKEYVSEYYGVNMIEVKWSPKQHSEHAPYNLYVNNLLNEVKEGWVIILDDDNKFVQNNTISKIIPHLTNKENLLFWKVQFPHNTIPESHCFGNRPQMCHIDTLCSCFHIDKLNNTKFDDTQLGDFNFINELYDLIPNKIWIDEVFFTLQRNDMGGRGMQDDLNI